MTYKLTYFSVAGRGEPIRFLLTYGGFDFEDNRISHDAWPTLKTEVPFGQLPVLEYKGKTINQSIAICRYLAKQVKLVGKNDWEDLEIDAIVDTASDLFQKVLTAVFVKGEKFEEQFVKEDVIYFLTKIDEQIKKNNGYLVLGRLTWADLVFTTYIDMMITKTNSGTFNKYPNIVELVKKVKEIPSIKKYLATRPKDA